ncbi:hypothetical protein LDENG_00210890 [Lucifuga dentata]|nr:hypothetical protein LDENG_00210890 [Lucifuga dentata]
MVTESIKDVALLHIMTGCCITNRHFIAQMDVITKETRTNSQQPSHLLIQPASKQKCRITQITQSDSTGFPTYSSHIKIHQTYQSCSSRLYGISSFS